MLEAPEGPAARRLSIALAVVIAVAYATVRLPFLLREPFFDELYTLWASRLDFDALITALRHDSGPPLYYLIASAFDSSVLALRLVSLALSIASLYTFVRLPAPVTVRATAALLLALFPANAYFSTEARAYALCAAAVGVAVVELARWRESQQWRHLAAASVALFVAAWSHYYGVLMFVLPLLAAAVPGGRDVEARRTSGPALRAIPAALLATLAIAAAFAPGFFLAALQPSAAAEWMKSAISPSRVAASVAMQLGFAPPLPPVVAAAPPSTLTIISLIAVVLLLGYGLRDRRSWIWGAFTLVPAAAAVTLVAAGVPAYFPMRFESVIAVPFVIWLATAASTLPRVPRRAAVATLLVLALYTNGSMLRAFAERDDDPYRNMANIVRRSIPAASTLAVSGLSYLEIAIQRDGEWRPALIALPAAQATHPGWREQASAETLRREVGELAKNHPTLFWVGEVPSAEARAVSARFEVHPILRRGPLLFARLDRK